MDPAAHFGLSADPFSARQGLADGESGPLAPPTQALIAAVRSGARLVNLIGGVGGERAHLMAAAERLLRGADVDVRRLAAADASVLKANADADALLVEELYGDLEDAAAAMRALTGQLIKPVIIFASEQTLLGEGDAAVVAVPPLSDEAARDFLMMRVAAAGGSAALLRPGAVTALTRAAGGSLTRLRVLAGNALLDAAIENADSVEASHVDHAAAMLPAMKVPVRAAEQDEAEAATPANETPAQKKISAGEAPPAAIIAPAAMDRVSAPTGGAGASGPRLSMSGPSEAGAYAPPIGGGEGRDDRSEGGEDWDAAGDGETRADGRRRRLFAPPHRRGQIAFAGALVVAILAAALFQWGGLSAWLYPRGSDTAVAAAAVQAGESTQPGSERKAGGDEPSSGPDLQATARTPVKAPIANDSMEMGRQSAEADIELGADTDTDADADAAGLAADEMEAADADVAAEAAQPPMRIVVHYARGRPDSLDRAEAIRAYLLARGYDVAALQPVAFNIGRGSTRYFFAADEARSGALNTQVSSVLTVRGADSSQLMDMTTYSPLPRPGTVEVWAPGGAG